MKKVVLLVMLLALVFGTVAIAGHHEKEMKKAVTVEGTMACSKCTLKAEGAEGCQGVIVVKKEDAEKHYWLIKNEIADKFGTVCSKKGSAVRVTGTVKEKDGKLWLLATEMKTPGEAKGKSKT